MRFDQTHDFEIINEAIPLSREALILLPPSHPDRSGLLFNLADALDAQFRETGNIDNIEEAISLLQEALLLNSPLHPEQCALLDGLANALFFSFFFFKKKIHLLLVGPGGLCQASLHHTYFSLSNLFLLLPPTVWAPAIFSGTSGRQAPALAGPFTVRLGARCR